jgi:hypothetical protein
MACEHPPPKSQYKHSINYHHHQVQSQIQTGGFALNLHRRYHGGLGRYPPDRSDRAESMTKRLSSWTSPIGCLALFRLIPVRTSSTTAWSLPLRAPMMNFPGICKPSHHLFMNGFKLRNGARAMAIRPLEPTDSVRLSLSPLRLPPVQPCQPHRD